MHKVPIVGVGAVVIHKNKVLLVKRAVEPYKNQWAIPGGKLRWGESLQSAAEREIREETGIVVVANKVVHTFEVIEQVAGVDYHFVVIDLQADYISGEIQAQDDAKQAAWFDQNEMKTANIQAATGEFLSQWWID